MYKVDIYLILHVSRYNMTVKTSNSESAVCAMHSRVSGHDRCVILRYIYNLVFRGVNEKMTYNGHSISDIYFG